MSQTERLYWIDAQIRDRRYPNAGAVAEHFEVSTRVAYQDRRYLAERLNAPIAMDRARGGWYYTDSMFMLPFLALTEQQASAVRRSLLAAQEYLGHSDAQAVGLLLDRFAAYLPRHSESESVGGSIHLAPESQANPALVEACRNGARLRRRLFIRYYSPHKNETTERIVRPYHLHYYQGEPHLLAWCEVRRDFRQFFLGRVRDWDLLEPDAAFVREPGFDPEAYWRQGLALQNGEPTVDVRIRFSEYQARWIRERAYHPSQRLEEQPDGGVVLALHVAGLAEVRRWLLSFGAEAEVLEPLELRRAVAEEAKKLHEIYGAAAE